MDVSYRIGRNAFRTLVEGMEKEWLLTNGSGGFANGCVTGANHRLFSGYLTASLNAPSDRKLIWSNMQEKIITKHKEFDFAAQLYVGYSKTGHEYLTSFCLDIVPTYYYQADDFTVKKTIAMDFGKNISVVTYNIQAGKSGGQFVATPFFKYTEPGKEASKDELCFQTKIDENKLMLIPEKDTSKKIIFKSSEGTYFNREQIPVSMATPNYLIDENTLYPLENRTGFMGLDNHATPFDVIIDLSPGEEKEVYFICGLIDNKKELAIDNSEEAYIDKLNGFEIVNQYKERMHGLMNRMPEDRLAKRLAWAADAFIVERESTGLKTILAGYPWFMDWGRDTMIALQGLTLCTKRFEEAKEILESFSRYVKDGMLPNVFPDSSQNDPMYNTIDASLWYFYSVKKYLDYTNDYEFIKVQIYPCLKEIINAYQHGTNFSIRMDEDGLIQGGSDLDQLTWMDVRVGNLVVTPRHGKAVEINALWYNALKIIQNLAKVYGEKENAREYGDLAKQVQKVYSQTFWNEKDGCLYDVVNGEKKDASIRPNQIYAVSLPYPLLDEEKEKSIVSVVYEQLYTPYGMRSLSNRDAAYMGMYIGKLLDRDLAYHMGTAWAFLSGGFITAYCKVHRYSKASVLKAREMCMSFEEHMQDGCLNGIAEIFDGDFACTSRGCFNQAWSVAEVLRAYMEDVLPHIVIEE